MRLARLRGPGAERRLGQLALGYGLLLPSLLALAQATRSFALDGLTAQPGQVEALPLLLRLAAVAGWALALAPLLRLGPFCADDAPLPGDGLRAVGHILVATLPLLALLGGRWWLAPLPPLALALLLAASGRWAAAAHTGRWALLARWAAYALWALLAWAALSALLGRAT